MSKTRRNILILSAGRRVELLKAFKSELAARKLDSLVLATDLNPRLSAACQFADYSFPVSRATSDGYVEELLQLCSENDVGLVIPTIDTELMPLSSCRAQFSNAGTEVIVSDQPIVSACRDKRDTILLFHSLGVSTPKTLARESLRFPCFARPYDGSRSIGAIKIMQASDLTDKVLGDPKMMFSELVDERFEEYTVDLYFDRSGTLKCLVPRWRIEVRDGEISKGITRKNHVYSYLVERLKCVVGARGCLTLQLFAHPKESLFLAFEVNPRFGGGFPLSYAAGANFPGWLIDEYLLGRDILFNDSWQPDLLMLRYDVMALINPSI